MYSNEAIALLEHRIGYKTSQDVPFLISESNTTATSGRHFEAFHSLVTVSNIYAAVPESQTGEGAFNAWLSDLRRQAVLSVVSSILDKNQDYIETKDYSGDIETFQVLFDDAIGYKVAAMALELYISTERKNFSERNAKLAISSLKLELEGFRNENGHLVAAGVMQKLHDAIQKATRKIFPWEPTIHGDPLW